MKGSNPGFEKTSHAGKKGSIRYSNEDALLDSLIMTKGFGFIRHVIILS
jgi:hypothetical protein